MGLPLAMDNLRRQTGMFVAPVTLDGVVAFISGYDAALSGGFLVGLREWLVPRLGYGNNLAWNGLILEMLPTKRNPGNEESLIEGLFVLLAEFIEVRQSHDGLRRIFVEYEQWLHRQEWYTPEHPGWCGPA
jgi:hypothetical protein